MTTRENLNAYIRYRVEKSEETYQAASLLAEAKMWNSVVNRLYYACFYAVTALLLNKDISTKTHAGTISQFSEAFVRTGIIPPTDLRIYSKLMNWRSKGDYGDMYDFEEEDILPIMEPTKEFIQHVLSFIVLDD